MHISLFYLVIHIVSINNVLENFSLVSTAKLFAPLGDDCPLLANVKEVVVNSCNNQVL
jgi:hypothetical protein